MPLPPPSPERKLLHTRNIVCEGFARADGLYDIDGWITDVRTYPMLNEDRGVIPPGEPLHGMGLRLTITTHYEITDAIAVTDFAPMTICPQVTPNFKRLVGLHMTDGFTKSVHRALGGVEGCTHLIDLLKPMAITAFQSIGGRHFAEQSTPAPGSVDAKRREGFINTCHGWRDDGPMVRRTFPERFTD